MATTRTLPPTWLMGFGFLPLGVSGAVMLITVPQLLSAVHVPEPRIASITAVTLIPTFASFLLAPLLDWRFSRRTYAIAFAIVGAACTAGAQLFLDNLDALTALLFVGSFAIGLYVAAVGGWFGNLTSTEHKSALGAWFTVANIGGGGVTASVAIALLRGLPFTAGVAILGGMMLLSLPLFLWVPCPPADGRLAHESFRAFARDLMELVGRRSVLWTLLLFLAPAASFALTNVLGGLGRDFGTPENVVGVLGGSGAVVAGVVGSLAVPRIGGRIPPRPLYLMVGVVGALFTLALINLPHTTPTFGLAMLGENAFQAAAFSVSNIIILRTIGHENPLAATQFGLLNAASSVPLVYMQALDGQGYAIGGVSGSLLMDAAISGAAAVALGLTLWLCRRTIPAI